MRLQLGLKFDLLSVTMICLSQNEVGCCYSHPLAEITTALEIIWPLATCFAGRQLTVNSIPL